MIDKALIYIVPFLPVVAREPYLSLLTPDADPLQKCCVLLEGDNGYSNSGNRQIDINKQGEITTTQGLPDRSTCGGHQKDESKANGTLVQDLNYGISSILPNTQSFETHGAIQQLNYDNKLPSSSQSPQTNNKADDTSIQEFLQLNGGQSSGNFGNLRHDQVTQLESDSSGYGFTNFHPSGYIPASNNGPSAYVFHNLSPNGQITQLNGGQPGFTPPGHISASNSGPSDG